MTLKQIKVGRWYDTELGIGKCERVGGTHPPSVKIDIVKPFPRGVRFMSPREVKREVTAEELAANGLGEATVALPPLPEKELVLAAKFFTVLNLGGEVPKAPRTVAQIERAYAKCKQDHGFENIDITDEYKDWIATFRKRDAYAMTTWAKDAATITDIATVRASS